MIFDKFEAKFQIRIQNLEFRIRQKVPYPHSTDYTGNYIGNKEKFNIRDVDTD
jgi:hypothetical protein